ncbi:MAG: hypothetical protein JW778_00695 [Candidatus Altiarchaeota archaeon]|nr:hypothetical protein [Candidatus Altiarchaeota archaeon]
MNKRIIAVAFLLLVPSAVAIIEVQVYVSGLIDGRIPHSEIPEVVNDTPQSFLVVWENTGSVGCGFRLRADIYEVLNDTRRQVYTSWGEEKPIEPGGTGNLAAYWYPGRSGNFTVRTFLYFCNSIKDGPAANFSVYRSNRTGSRIPAEITTEATEDYVEFRFDPKEDINSILIVPRDYPTGWVFESKSLESIKKGEENTVRLGYEASIWKERNITFDIVSADGRFYQSSKVSLMKKEEFPIYQAIIMFLVIVILILSVQLLRYRREGCKGDEKGIPEK